MCTCAPLVSMFGGGAACCAGLLLLLLLRLVGVLRKNLHALHLQLQQHRLLRHTTEPAQPLGGSGPP